MAGKAGRKTTTAKLNCQQWRVILDAAGVDRFLKIADKLGIRTQAFHAVIRSVLEDAQRDFFGYGPLISEFGARFALLPGVCHEVRSLLVRHGEACKLEELLRAQEMPKATVEEIITMAGWNFRHGARHRYNWKQWAMLEEMAEATKDRRLYEDVRQKHRQCRQDDAFDG